MLIAAGGVAVLEADVVEHEELGLGADEDGVADAGRLEIGLGALGGRARVAAVELAGRRLDDVAEQDHHRRRAERIDIDGVEVRLQDHVALVDRLPAGDRGAVEHEAVGQLVLVDHARATIVRCCHLPLGSVKRRSTHSISSSLMRERMVPASFAIDVVPTLEIVGARTNRLAGDKPDDSSAIRAWDFRFLRRGAESGGRRIFHWRMRRVSSPWNCSARRSFRRRSGTRRRVCYAFRSALADRHSDPHHPAARAVHAPFLSSACIPA